jgi:hypothetical protein
MVQVPLQQDAHVEPFLRVGDLLSCYRSGENLRLQNGAVTRVTNSVLWPRNDVVATLGSAASNSTHHQQRFNLPIFGEGLQSCFLLIHTASKRFLG